MAVDAAPDWEVLFRAPLVSFPDWSPHAPDRLVYASNEPGAWQVFVWDLASGDRRQVTDHPVGVVDGTPTLDGSGVLWFQDETGDESGQWFHQPFDGGPVEPFMAGVPHGWNEGLAQAPGIVVAAVSDRDGFALYAAIDGELPKEIARSVESISVQAEGRIGFARGGLSADGRLLCVEVAEADDVIHPALRVLDPRTGATVADLRDEGMGLHAAAWSPVAGDQRLAIIHERDGEDRPAIWDLASGERTDLHLDLPGIVQVHDWWPDGSALLLINLHEGRDTLWRCDVPSGTLTRIPSPEGVVEVARVRPDGAVWFHHSQAHRLPTVLDDRGERILGSTGEDLPPSRAYTAMHFQNQQGETIHGWYVTPDGPGPLGGPPYPVMMRVHGGPDWLDLDAWNPEVQTYVDAGFVVGRVNYRGSIGFGREWRDTLIGNIGGPELEDVNAGLAHLVELGVADPSRAVIAGWSWGGYITLMELGKHPELWTCGVAGVPVGDYEVGYEELSPLLQAFDRALIGGTPPEVPELMRDRNPIYFADQVRVPVLFVAGLNDSRCPINQVMAYVDKLAERGHPHELYTFETGHGSNDTEEGIRQMRVIVDFLARNVPAR
jgi:dipeptidyl aminopeptidase/acylaminoacyl peptidase